MVEQSTGCVHAPVKLRCNMCGSIMDYWDVALGFNLHMLVGYGSQYDGDRIDLDICSNCFDKHFPKVIKACKISPISSVNKRSSYGEEN